MNEIALAEMLQSMQDISCHGMKFDVSTRPHHAEVIVAGADGKCRVAGEGGEKCWWK